MCACVKPGFPIQIVGLECPKGDGGDTSGELSRVADLFRPFSPLKKLELVTFEGKNCLYFKGTYYLPITKRD